MTVKSGNTFIIEPEPSRNCELCGAFEECRPYGPNGEQGCISCGLKNLKSTIAAFYKRVLGTSEVPTDRN